MGVLSKRRWITNEEAELHYISTRLGQMEKEGFKFFYPGAPAEWNPDYLESVLSHDFSLQMLRTKQKWESDYHKPIVGANVRQEISEAEKVKRLQRSRAMYEAMSADKKVAS